jgi:futalosine hydrolase
MFLLLMSATDFEVSETVDWFSRRPQTHNASTPDLLISGIGQMQAAYALGKKIRARPPSLVIQAGIGGSGLPADLGNTFVIDSEVLADLGARDKSGFRSLFDIGLDQAERFPFREGKLINPYGKLLAWTGLPVRKGITVNEIKSTDLNEFQRNQPPVVESMEGAALHYVCLMEKIPFLQVRSVSNLTGDRDKNNWRMKEARESLHQSLVLLIQKLEKADETLFGI